MSEKYSNDPRAFLVLVTFFLVYLAQTSPDRTDSNESQTPTKLGMTSQTIFVSLPTATHANERGMKMQRRRENIEHETLSVTDEFVLTLGVLEGFTLPLVTQ